MSRRPRRRSAALIAAVLLLLQVPPPSPRSFRHRGRTPRAGGPRAESRPRRRLRQRPPPPTERVRPARRLPDPMVSLSYETTVSRPPSGRWRGRASPSWSSSGPVPREALLAGEIAMKDANARRPARTGPSRPHGRRPARYAALLQARENLVIVDEQLRDLGGIEEVTRRRYRWAGDPAGRAEGPGREDEVRAAARVDRAAEETSLSSSGSLFRPAGTPLPTEARLSRAGYRPPVGRGSVEEASRGDARAPRGGPREGARPARHRPRTPEPGA